MIPVCPICESSSHVTKYGENKIVTLFECSDCQFAFQDRDSYKNPYAAIDYYDPTKQPCETYPLTLSKTDLDRITSVQNVIANGKLLEIGGGLGRTSIMASVKGYDVTLTEESRLAVENGARYHPQLNWIQTSEIPLSLKNQSFDAVMMFHVLEHITDLKGFLNEAVVTLKDKSYFIVEVPNWMSMVRKIRKMDWLYVLDHHHNQFSKQALIKLFALYDFHPVAVEYRRTFAINENQPLKEKLKRVLCRLGFGNVIRVSFARKVA